MFQWKKKTTASSIAKKNDIAFDSIIDGMSLRISQQMTIGSSALNITNSTIDGVNDSAIVGGAGSTLVIGDTAAEKTCNVTVDRIDVDVLIVRGHLFAHTVKCNHLVVESASANIPALLQAQGDGSKIVYDTLSCGDNGVINGLLQHVSVEKMEEHPSE